MKGLSRLFRVRLALLNAVAALGGYLLFPGEAEMAPAAVTLLGVALLAAGGSALNQVLERDLDRLMARTRLRPLPQGELTPLAASLIGSGTILTGVLLLFAVAGQLPALLGCAALVWYLALYTPLKHRTPFALLVGAVCGAFPPIIGWCVAGGHPADYRIILLAGLLYIWQVPHFWLLQHRHREDYRSAGIPLLENAANSTGQSALYRLWLVALFATAMILPALGMLQGHVALWYAASLLPLMILSGLHAEGAPLSQLNLFPLIVTLALLAQK